MPLTPIANEVEALQAQGLDRVPQLVRRTAESPVCRIICHRAISFPRCSFCGVGDLEVLTLKHSAEVLFFA